MENITMTNTTQITRVRFAWPQIADRSLTRGTGSVGVRGLAKGTGVSAFGVGVTSGSVANGGFRTDLAIYAITPVPTFHAPMHKALAVKDVAYLRSWSPPV